MNIIFFGLGSIGQRHLQNIVKLYPKFKLYCYKKNNNTFLIKNGKINKKIDILKKYRIKKLTKISDLKKYQFDFAFICNPSSLHLKYAIIAAKHGINLFIEKPLSDSLKDIIKLKKLILKKNLKCFIGFNLRFNPCYQYIKKKIDSKNFFGKIYKVDLFNGEYLPDYHKYEDYRKSYAAKKKLGGGVLLTQIHEIDLALSLFDLPKKIIANINQISHLKIDVEDNADVIMEMKNKIMLNLHLDYITKPSTRYLKIFSYKKNLFWDYYKNSVIIYDKISTKEKKINFGKFNRNQMFIDQIKNIFENTNSKFTPNLQSGIDSLKTVIKIKK